MYKNTHYRLINLAVVLAMAFVSVTSVGATALPAIPQATTITFKPTADGYVIQSSAGSNYGSAVNLRVDNSPVTRSYLRFVVSGLSGGVVQSAVLKLYANSSDSTGLAVRSVSNNTWSESGITYSNSPATGNVIASSKQLSAGTWVEVNVTSYIKANGTFNLALTTTSTTNTSLGSRESGSKAPQLVVTTVEPGNCDSDQGAHEDQRACNTHEDQRPCNPNEPASRTPQKQSRQPALQPKLPYPPALRPAAGEQAGSHPSRSGPRSITPGSRKPGTNWGSPHTPITRPNWATTARWTRTSSSSTLP